VAARKAEDIANAQICKEKAEAKKQKDAEKKGRLARAQALVGVA
jgi:hypothetical protein